VRGQGSGSTASSLFFAFPGNLGRRRATHHARALLAKKSQSCLSRCFLPSYPRSIASATFHSSASPDLITGLCARNCEPSLEFRPLAPLATARPPPVGGRGPAAVTWDVDFALNIEDVIERFAKWHALREIPTAPLFQKLDEGKRTPTSIWRWPARPASARTGWPAPSARTRTTIAPSSIDAGRSFARA